MRAEIRQFWGQIALGPWHFPLTALFCAVPIFLVSLPALSVLAEPQRGPRKIDLVSRQKTPDQAQEAVQGLTFYMLPFTEETPSEITSENIVNENAKVIATNSIDVKRMYSYLKDGLYKERVTISRATIRLRIDAQNGKPMYLVDHDGVVQVNKRQYYMTPVSFLRLHYLMLQLSAYDYKNRKGALSSSMKKT